VLAAADGVVAASTGPLHLAALAGTRALGLFSPQRPIHPGRWAPIGPHADVVVAPAAAPGDPLDAPADTLAAIGVDAVRERVMRWEASARPAPR
jgi:ADP-heptose:LPS heptosyltransferase